MILKSSLFSSKVIVVQIFMLSDRLMMHFGIFILYNRGWKSEKRFLMWIRCECDEINFRFWINDEKLSTKKACENILLDSFLKISYFFVYTKIPIGPIGIFHRLTFFVVLFRYDVRRLFEWYMHFDSAHSVWATIWYSLLSWCYHSFALNHTLFYVHGSPIVDHLIRWLHNGG